MKLWVISLGLAAGLGLAGEDAFADRRHGGSSAQRHHHQSRPHHGHHHRHHVRPHRHHHHHGHSHLRFWAAPVIVAPPAYYYYSAPPPVEYIEQPRPAPPQVLPAPNTGYWYYCPGSRAYYPYVLECGSGWQQVTPGAGPPG